MDDYVTSIIEASAALTGRVDKALHPLGLQAATYRLLSHLREAERNKERLTPSWIAGLLVQQTHSVSGLLNRLEDREPPLVTRERDRYDRRVVWVELTPAGREILHLAEASYREIVDDFVAALMNCDVEHLAAERIRDAAIAISGFDDDRRATALIKTGAAKREAVV